MVSFDMFIFIPFVLVCCHLLLVGRSLTYPLVLGI
jgi:hypothetical protein